MGLPCAHTVDDRQLASGSLLPNDFHRHWWWDRYEQLRRPILDPIQVITTSSRAPPTTSTSTRRLPSGFEASNPRVKRCSACRQPGHQRNSLNCPVKVRRRFQELQELVEESEPILPLVPLINRLESPPYDRLESPPNDDPRPIYPSRIEVIYAKYIAEKEAWLLGHIGVQPANYRQARGLPNHSLTWQEIGILPSQRLDLQLKKLLPGDPNWSNEEIQAFLDYKERQEDDYGEQEEVRYDRQLQVNGFGQERRSDIWRQFREGLEREDDRNRELYQFVD